MKTKKRATHPAAYHPEGGPSDIYLYLSGMSKIAVIDVLLDILEAADSLSLEEVVEICKPRLRARNDRSPDITKASNSWRQARLRKTCEHVQTMEKRVPHFKGYWLITECAACGAQIESTLSFYQQEYRK